MVDDVKVAEKTEKLESLRKIDDNLRLPSVPERIAFPKEIGVSAARMQTPAVGQRATRPDGRMHGLGQTKYIDDMFFPGMIHAKIKRAGIAHAKIKRIDVSEAEKMPGVMATLIGSEIPVNASARHCKINPCLPMMWCGMPVTVWQLLQQ
jgi:xanthine dehydrogenase molybdopterin-binding subunit B